MLAKPGVIDLPVCGMITQNGVTHSTISKAVEKYNVTTLPDCCNKVCETLRLVALHAVSTRVNLVPMSEVLWTFS